MVPRPGSTTPEDGVNVEQELRAGALSIERSSTASELEERPSASCSSEGTYTTGHAASDEEEAYESQFVVPDVVSPRATMDFDTARRKKKMRAPDSAEESPSGKPRKKDPPREYAPEELDRIVSRVELAQHLERSPVLKFLQPELLNEHTGPVAVPDVNDEASVRLGCGSVETSHHCGSGPAERPTNGHGGEDGAQHWVVGADTSDDYLVTNQGGDPSPSARGSARQANADPDDARCYRRDHANPICAPNVPEPVVPDVAMASVSSSSSTHDHHDLDEASDALFDLEPNTAGQAATVAAATAGAAGVALVRTSAFSELKEFHRRDASE
ncbi:unnamed protein product [Phytophthora fragariaefolia]|uniref:Unnamed protein product n=1 Tax=Phytophthora fragariaefolia TaxID=1490495 RepID=A0A9W6X905_9STRA|nr:unnamed protein product [Phytophthora fragariaefolia]